VAGCPYARADGDGFYVVWPGGLLVLLAMIMFGVSLAF
jgi:hypothetical protein